MTDLILQNEFGVVVGGTKYDSLSDITKGLAGASRLVFVDDDQILLDSFAFAFGRHHNVDIYVDPHKFLDALASYDDTAQFVIDYHFDHCSLSGLMVAERLHELKFTRIVLMSGTDLSLIEVPSYLMAIRKSDVMALVSMLGKTR